MELEIVRQPKQGCQVEQHTRNWLDLPSELMANILYRVGVFGILQSAQKVCTAWCRICKDPAMWRVVCVDAYSDDAHLQTDKTVMHVVDRSQGQLADITAVDAVYHEILIYIANRCSQLRRLTIVCSDDALWYGAWTISLKKFPLLEELSLYATDIWKGDIETAGRYCPMLRTLKVNIEDHRYLGILDDEYSMNDVIAMAIGKNLHELRHLELIGSPLSNKGLEMILDGCQHLELLDLRGCWFINLDGDLGKRCSRQIKCVKLPNDSLEGCPYIY